MNKGELYKLRRSMGLCTLCGMPLEKDGGKYRYACPECRAKKRAYQAQYKQGVRISEERRAEAIRKELAEQPPKKARDAAQRMRAPEKCQRCAWASYAGGGVWFCPLEVEIPTGDFKSPYGATATVQSEGLKRRAVGCVRTGRRGA